MKSCPRAQGVAVLSIGIVVLFVGLAHAAWQWLDVPGESMVAATNDNNNWEDLSPRGYTLAQLRPFTGEQDSGCGLILVAISGKVYDVTKRGKSFYGPGKRYHVFAGRDASRGLAKMSLKVEDVKNPRVDDLTLSEIDTLGDWTLKFKAKYSVVGFLVDAPQKSNLYNCTLAELRKGNEALARKICSRTEFCIGEKNKYIL